MRNLVVPSLLLTFLFRCVNAMRLQTGIEGPSKFEAALNGKYIKLNYYYFIRDDASKSGIDPMLLRLGRAHFWQYG